MEQSVLVSTPAPGVALITLNRPESMNSLGPDVLEELEHALSQASAADETRAIVLTGAGRGFCSGANAVGMLSGGGASAATPSRHQRMDRRGSSASLVELMAACETPIIGAINGPAAGAGFGLALCCDIRIASETARLGSVFIKRGTASDFGVAYWLPRIVGVARAYEMLYSGELLDAKTALQIGLVHRVVPAEQLLEETVAYAARIASGPPLAHTALRRIMLQSQDLSLHQFLEYEWTAQLDLLRTKDCVEGFRSFVERRDPNFTGE